MKLCLIFLVLSYLLLSFVQKASASNEELYNGTISGNITTADNRPAADVAVFLSGTNKNAFTNNEGNFIFKHIKPGTYTIVVSYLGYEPVHKTVQVDNDSTSNIYLQLKISLRQLQEVVVVSNRTMNDETASIGNSHVKLKDLPQSVVILDKKLLQQQQVATLGDALMNVPGVYVMGETGGYQQELGARGYVFGNNNTFKNGIRFNNGLMPEMSGVEKIEFLQGSAAILEGNVVAGGILNLVTKKPQFERGGEISMNAGSYDYYQPELDIYGPVGDSKTVAFRVNTTFEKSNSFRDDVHSQRYYINPSFLIKASPRTQILIEGDYLSDYHTLDYGIGAINFKVAPIPRRTFLGIPWSHNEGQEGNATVTTTHRFNNNWQLKNITGFYQYDDHLFGTTRPGDGGGVPIEANGNWVRGVQEGVNTESYYVTKFEANGKFYTGSVKHQLLLGLVGNLDLPHTLAYNPLVVYDSINIFHLKEYPQRSDVPVLTKSSFTKTSQYQAGVYAQDLISLINKLKLLVGARYNYVETHSNVYSYAHQSSTVTRSESHPFTPQAGIVYQPSDDISLYADYANSFVLNSGVDTSGKALPPSFINQYEAGIKSDWFHHLVSLDVSAYRIVNSNLAQTSLANGNTNRNIKELDGQVTSDGVEANLISKPMEGLSFRAGYSYDNTRYTKSNVYKDGSPLQYFPANAMNASAYYAFGGKALRGLSVGINGLYEEGMMGGKETRLNVPDDNRRLIPLPAFTQVNLTAAYAYKMLTFGVKISNLFDAMGYYAHEDESINPIAPREVSATVSCKL